MRKFVNKSIDKTRTDFGAVLGRCLQAMNVRNSQFADQISIAPPAISNITNNQKPITQKWVDDKQIFETLKQINPEIFVQFEPELKRAYKTLPAYPHAPHGKKYSVGFGETLAAILTESKLTLKSFCIKSKIEYADFNNRLRANNLSQSYLSKIKLREHLENITGGVFTHYAQNFDEMVATLPKKSKAYKRQNEYSHQGELGGLIDRFLRDGGINIADLARTLKISHQRLHQIITGQDGEPSVEWVKKRRLYDVLNELNPELFQTMNPEFENWEQGYISRHRSEKATKPRKEKPIKEPKPRGRPRIEKALKISVDFYNAVHNFVRDQMAAYNDTPESIKEKFTNAAKDLKIKDSFIVSAACLNVICDQEKMNDHRLTDARIVKTLRVISYIYNEASKRDAICHEFRNLPVIQTYRAQFG